MRSSLNIGYGLSHFSVRLSASLVLLAICTLLIHAVGGYSPSMAEAEIVEGVNYQVKLFDGVGTDETITNSLG